MHFKFGTLCAHLITQGRASPPCGPHFMRAREGVIDFWYEFHPLAHPIVRTGTITVSTLYPCIRTGGFITGSK